MVNTVNLKISGMHCNSCALNIERNLKNERGIINTTVNFVNETVTIIFNDNEINLQKIEDKILHLGYGVVKENKNKIEMQISGMTCNMCRLRVEKALNKLDGVSATVDLTTEKAFVEYNNNKYSIGELISAVTDAGYGAKLIEKEIIDMDKDQKDKEINNLKIKFVISSILSFPLLIAMLLSFFKNNNYLYNNIVDFLHNPVFQLILASPVQFYIGFRFYKNGFKNIKSLSPGMDFLIALGTTAAFFLSIYNGFFVKMVEGKPHNLYFEASAIVITLVILGKFLESIARGKMSESIKKLIGIKPKHATIVKNNIEIEIPIENLNIGDIVVVKPGEKIATDGIIIEGESTVDQSIVTGESIPVDKKVEDIVIGATINKSGTFKFKVTKVGKETMLSQIIKIVTDAQGGKAPIQRVADKVANIFVPTVLIVSILTLIIWAMLGNFEKGLISAVSILVIACPCALGLATPTAIMVGTGRGAELGILLKNSETLETVHKIDTIVFDKTGTITKGKLEVTDLIMINNYDKNTLLRIIGSIEKKSEHPIGVAIFNFVKTLANDFDEPKNFKNIPGKGIEANIDDNNVLIGTINFIKEKGIDVHNIIYQIDSLYDQSKSTVIVTINNKIEAIIGLKDQIRDSSKNSVSNLKKSGYEIIMLTGDNFKTAKSIGLEVGIENIIAEVLPEKKADEIKKLKDAKKMVAMVGDGINDAPALALSDIGIAMGTGTDIAIETGDIVITNSDLNSIITAIRLSKKTIGKIKQNLFWAFFYNIIGIPIAAVGLLNPVIAGIAMAFSSVSVVTNSLLLRRFR